MKRTWSGRGFAMSMIGAGLLAACGGSTTNKGSQTAVVSPPKSGSCTGSKSTARPMTPNAASSTLALATVGAKRVAFIADEDAKAILTVDLDSQAQLAETRLDGAPAQVWVANDGRVFTTLRNKNELAVLSVTAADAPLTGLCSVATPAEPIAIAATPDESTVVVTTGWGQKLAAFDGKTLASKYEVRVPREPRSVVVADDGSTAFVSHAVGSIVSAVALAAPKHELRSVSMRGFEPGQTKAISKQREFLEQMKKTPTGKSLVGGEMLDRMNREAKRLEEGRPSCQGFALAKSTAVGGRIFAPQVMVNPGNFEQRPDGYGDEHSDTETPSVAVIDEGTAAPLASSTLLSRDPKLFRSLNRDHRNERPECLLPRAAVVDPKSKSLLVTCYGIDAVVAYDATAANPLAAERRRWTVGSGPSGVAIDPQAQRVVVWSQFDRTLSTFAVGDDELIDDSKAPLKVKRTALAPLHEKMPAEYALGRILFHAAGDARIASDGRACASCHPDGRDDAITWATPEGPRRSIMLAGRTTQTAPYSWNGNETTLHGHLGNTFDRLSGRGVRSIELDALVTYISQMPAPTAQAGTDKDKAKVDRGRAIFASSEAGCSSCHSGANFTDGLNHDVGSKHKADRAGSFNTPSLHLVGGAGPYFHDGRYDTLSELLTRSDGQMGHTKHLSNGDLDALETFLRTL
jgi:DNA-binding beta-propeller fold protein YncE